MSFHGLRLVLAISTMALLASAACRRTEPDAASPSAAAAGDKDAPAVEPAAPPNDSPSPETSSASTPAGDPSGDPPAEPTSKLAPPLPEPVGLTRLAPDFRVWIDLKQKQVVVDGVTCLNEGQLEMFACPKSTKEHESLVAVESDGRTIHAALLAIGAKPGSPVQFDPVYKPATGAEIEITMKWLDAKGEWREARAQEWVRNVRSGQKMTSPWVFAGSGFWTDEGDGKQYYHGDSGDLICLSNFPTATLDLPVESTQANGDLLFEVFREQVPPRNTRVRMVLAPKPAAAKPAAAKPETARPETAKPAEGEKQPPEEKQ